ncbi:MAG TPA: hypothetical protein VGM88_06320 [Kofleriaceae bacterium]|jgi:hypothetical protein
MLRSFARSLSVVIALVGGVAFVGTAQAAPAHKTAKAKHHKKAKARKAHHKHSRKKALAEKPVEPPRPMP